MPNNAIPLPEPVYYQWRRLNMPWSLEFAFDSRCHATTDDSEVRTLHTAGQMHAHAAAVSAAKDAEIAQLRAELFAHQVYIRVLCKAVDAATDFAGTVAGGASWWDDVWAEHFRALDAARAALEQTGHNVEVT